MKIAKFYSLLLFGVCVCGFMTSCGDDDDSSSSGSTDGTAHLQYWVTKSGSVVYDSTGIERNSKGEIVSVQSFYNNGTSFVNTQKCSLLYFNGSVQLSVLKGSGSSASSYTLTCALDAADNRITSMYGYVDGYANYDTMSYSAQGFLTSINTGRYSGETNLTELKTHNSEIYSYNASNLLTSYSKKYDFGQSISFGAEYTYTDSIVTSPIANKGCIWLSYFPEENVLGSTGLFGKPMAYLPIKIVYRTPGVVATSVYTWKIDNNGYPAWCDVSTFSSMNKTPATTRIIYKWN